MNNDFIRGRRQGHYYSSPTNEKEQKFLTRSTAVFGPTRGTEGFSLILSHQRHLSPTVYLTLLTHQIHTISAYRSIKFDDSRVRTVSALEESHSIALAISPWHVSKPPFAPSWPLPLILGPVVLFVDLWFLAPLLQVKIKHGSNGAMMGHTLWRVLDCILRCPDQTILSVRLSIESNTTGVLRAKRMIDLRNTKQKGAKHTTTLGMIEVT